MPKVGMGPIRRRQLIEATIASISEYGMSAVTVSKIGKKAGVSPGIIHHYFGDKNSLIEATMRSLLEDLRVAVVARLRQAKTPYQRAIAVIDGNFAPEQFDHPAVFGWLELWAQSLHFPELARLRRANTRRLRSNLRHALRPLLPENEVEEAGFGLAAMIDGLWLHSALTSGGLDFEKARQTAHNYLDRLIFESLPMEDPSEKRKAG